MWPDYCKKETLAKRLDLAVGAVEQLVKRGLLPSPHRCGEALLWYWPEVDSAIRGNNAGESEHVDPYLAGIERAAQTAATRRQGQKPDRPAVPLSAEASRNGASREGNTSS